MSDSSYPRFCPVAMAASLLEPRWTMLVLCEMWSGSTRFNEIKRGVPGMSPGLLSKRLKDMEANGLVARRCDRPGGHPEYVTTPIADELAPLIQGLGAWAHRNIECEVSLQDLDARLLMWRIRGNIEQLQLPKRKSTIQFILKNPPDQTANYWLVAKPGKETDLCFVDPKFDVDLFVVCELRALTAAWLGHSTFEDEIRNDRISLIGNDLMSRTVTAWLRRSSFAELSQRGFSPPLRDTA